MPKKSADPEIIDNSSSVNVGSLKVDFDVNIMLLMIDAMTLNMVMLIGVLKRIIMQCMGEL